jgi:Protein kinase domain
MTSEVPRRVILDVGSVVGGYRLEALLGYGGMGVVYRAQHLALQRPAAVKIIQPQMADTPEFRDRFRRESRTAASLEHPNIVPIFDAGDADGVLYIAMRLIAGQDLAARIAAQGPLPPEQAVQVTAQIASALDAAHDAGLVHRDVKPANVLLLEDGSNHAYLTDFGVTTGSATMRGLTAAGKIVGSVDFIAPEQLRGETVDRRTDVYALAALLYQALTGRVPFPRDNDLATMWAHINEEPPTVTKWVLDLPHALDVVIARGLAKAPEDRPRTAGALAAAARAAVEGRVVDLHRASAGTQAGSSVRTASVTAPVPHRHRGWILPACGVGAFLLYLVGLFVLPTNDPITHHSVPDIRAWYHQHQFILVVGAGLMVLGVLLFLGFVASLPRLISERDGRLSPRALATLAAGVGFVVLVIVDRIVVIVLAVDAQSAGPALVKFLWLLDGHLEPLFVALAAFLVAGTAAEAERNGTLPPALTRSGIPLGLFVGIGFVIYAAIPFTIGDSLNNVLILVFAIVAGWLLVTSVTMITRALDTTS